MADKLPICWVPSTLKLGYRGKQGDPWANTVLLKAR